MPTDDDDWDDNDDGDGVCRFCGMTYDMCDCNDEEGDE
jgi:hypothetical protein